MQTAEAKVWDRDEVLALLERSNEATGRALYGLFERQTADERATNSTKVHNGRGFNGRDAEFLSSIAKKLPDYEYKLTERQLPHVRRKLRKYTRQLLEIIEAKGGKVSFKTTKKHTAASVANNDVAVVAVVENVVTVDRPAQYGLF